MRLVAIWYSSFGVAACVLHDHVTPLVLEENNESPFLELPSTTLIRSVPSFRFIKHPLPPLRRTRNLPRAFIFHRRGVECHSRCSSRFSTLHGEQAYTRTPKIQTAVVKRRLRVNEDNAIYETRGKVFLNHPNALAGKCENILPVLSLQSTRLSFVT